jgi:hypothetical protein
MKLDEEKARIEEVQGVKRELEELDNMYSRYARANNLKVCSFPLNPSFSNPRVS